MNKELILQDLQTISDFLNEAGFETKITDNSLKEPKIVAIFPINDEIEKILTLTYIDLPKENLELSIIMTTKVQQLL